MFTDSQIERMRYELEHPEAMQKRINEENEEPEINKFIKATKEHFKAEGRDFDKEFSEYQKNSRTQGRKI